MLLGLALLAAAAPVRAQAPLRFKGTILDVPDAGSLTGPAGRFWFPDWGWPTDVDREHDWSVDPRTYATRVVAIGDLLVGEVEALRPGGDRPVRSLVWDRALRPSWWGAEATVLAATEDGMLLVSLRGGEEIHLIDGKRDQELEVPKLESWKPLVARSGGLFLGVGDRRGEPVLVVLRRKRSKKVEARLIPSRLRPRDVNETGWVIGADGADPAVLGPLLRDGALVAEDRLAELTPLEWQGPPRAQLVAFAGSDIAGHAKGANGRSRAWVWPLDPRAATVGGAGEELPAPHGDAVVIDANASGLILGRSGGRPILWKRRGDQWEAHDLRRRLPKNAPYQLLDVTGINDRGHIAGTAQLKGATSGQTYQRGIRLVPRRG